MSRLARRRYSASEQIGDGGMFSRSSLASTRSSIELRRSALANVFGRQAGFRYGTVHRAQRRFCSNTRRLIDPSPLPVTFTLPTSSTWQTVRLVEVNLAQVVTSSV